MRSIASVSTWPCAPGNTYWVNTGSTSSVNYWRTSTVDPRSGLYHVRWVRPAESNNNVILNPRMGINCIPVFGGFFGTYSARCEPGDTVTTSVYMKASTLTNGPQIQIHINWYDIDYGSAGAASSSTAVNLTTSYANYSHSGVAPATTRFAYIEWVPITGGGYPVGATLDADDGLVGVEAA